VEITRDIVEHPESWTGSRVVDELPVHMYDGDDAEPGQDVPTWLRDVMVLCDFETHPADGGAPRVVGEQVPRRLDRCRRGAALRSVRLEDHAALLNEAVDVLGPGNVRAAAEVNSVSSFTQRHPEMTDEQLEHGRTIEERLTLEGPDGADLRSALIAHAESGLAGMQRAS